MKKAFLTILLTLLLTGTSLFAQGYKPTRFNIKDPELLEKSSIELTGPWDFYWGRLVNDKERLFPDCKVTLPSTWNNYDLSDEAHKIAKTGKGSGTYKLLVSNLQPNTEYAFRTYDIASTAVTIYVNGLIVLSSGTANPDWKKTRVGNDMALATFMSDSKGEALFSMFISNDVYRSGGVWSAPKISLATRATKRYNQSIGYLSILAGLLIAVIIYGLFLFILKKDKANLFLALFSLSILIRMSSSAFPIIKQFFSGIPYPVMLRLEYSALFLSPITYIAYLSFLDEDIFRKIRVSHIAYLGIFLGVLTTATPIKFSNHLVPILQVYLGGVLLFVLISLILYTIRTKNSTGFFCLATVLIILIASFNDIFIGKGIGITIFESELLPFAFVIFTICQTIILAYVQVQSEKHVQELYNYLVETNKAYHRFVPKQLLELFNKNNITELQIGENFTRNMMILSADIRNFTATSEDLSGIQVFEFLNGYFAQIAPVIEQYGGIIEKYLGDGIIAFFPHKCEAALQCAIKMQETMNDLRKDFIEKGLPELKIGIGIHYGNVLIGTAGDASRMSEISISKDLIILQHAESATKRYNKSIIATKEAIAAASKEAKAKGKKFDFFGKKVEEAMGHELYYIYNENITKEL